MKKLLDLTMAAILLVSCSDDDSSSSVSAEKLIGKWYPTTTQIKGLKAEPYENDCATAKDYTEFKANGVGTDVYYDTDCDSNSDNITYTLTGKKITINFDEEFTLTGTIQ
ncbi:lipocalin family protein [Flavobacterium psychrotrophum]|uniref:lipocalin family protein n=1 Tax=Flavobacterium psychrotrophum TaxID=2294119 RepID=UPI000E31048E|nr:lipocalin family protein [Flavobacterium psychrotrophum]